MRCLVTGGAGFIGRHLTRRLLAEGHTVSIVDSLSRVAVPTLSQLGPGIRVLACDVADSRAMAQAMSEVEVVFHLAAPSAAPNSDEALDDGVRTSVLGTINVLRAAAQAGVRRCVFASSCAVYGEPAVVPVDEAQPLQPKTAAAASTVAAEAYCRALGHAGGMSTVILRLASVYGPGDHGRLIARWLAHACAGRDIEVHGGHQVLDLVPVDCVVAALYAAADADVLASVVNVGSGQGLRLGEVARRVLSATRSSSRIVIRPPRPEDVSRFVADVRRMISTLDVEPPTDPLAALADMASVPAAVPVAHVAAASLA